MRIVGISLVAMLIVVVAAPAVLAYNNDPVGLWKTIDGETGQARSYVTIWLDNGELFGRIEQLILKPGDDPNPKCEKCSGDRKNQPLLGMTIIWGLTSKDGAWMGGSILDPDDGNVYTCTVEPGASGKTLEVRGYIGIPLLGRTQTWVRVERVR